MKTDPNYQRDNEWVAKNIHTSGMWEDETKCEQ
jgi:hypothetical protein